MLAFIDVDGHQQVNDHEGHVAGDLLLHEVCSIQEQVRSYDPIVRMGADEFVCALGEATAEDVRPRFEKVQATVADARSGSGLSFGLIIPRRSSRRDAR